MTVRELLLALADEDANAPVMVFSSNDNAEPARTIERDVEMAPGGEAVSVVVISG